MIDDDYVDLDYYGRHLGCSSLYPLDRDLALVLVLVCEGTSLVMQRLLPLSRQHRDDHGL